MRRAILFAVSMLALAPATAAAVTLHVHKQIPVHPVVGHDPTGPLHGTEMKTVTTVVRVAPTDVDQDGLADVDDDCPNIASTVNGGCPPPPPAPVAAPAPAPVASTTYAAPTTSSGGCPSYMAAEASSPDAVNSSSGASGCYQVLPSTAAAMGSACSDVNASSCVAAICATAGNGAWAASGATPCDYLP